jgi:hypothetical protein
MADLSHFTIRLGRSHLTSVTDLSHSPVWPGRGCFAGVIDLSHCAVRLDWSNLADHSVLLFGRIIA